MVSVKLKRVVCYFASPSLTGSKLSQMAVAIYKSNDPSRDRSNKNRDKKLHSFLVGVNALRQCEAFMQCFDPDQEGEAKFAAICCNFSLPKRCIQHFDRGSITGMDTKTASFDRRENGTGEIASTGDFTFIKSSISMISRHSPAFGLSLGPG